MLKGLPVDGHGFDLFLCRLVRTLGCPACIAPVFFSSGRLSILPALPQAARRLVVRAQAFENGDDSKVPDAKVPLAGLLTGFSILGLTGAAPRVQLVGDGGNGSGNGRGSGGDGGRGDGSSDLPTEQFLIAAAEEDEEEYEEVEEVGGRSANGRPLSRSDRVDLTAAISALG